jgi:signal transduction histidine kinase
MLDSGAAVKRGTQRIAAVLLLSAAVAAAQPLVMGYSQFPPLSYRTSSGLAAGLVVEVMEEAARREGIRLEWRYAAGGGPDLLQARTVEAWPTLHTPQPLPKGVFATDPWWHIDTQVLTPLGSPIQKAADLSGKRVAIQDSPFYRSQVERHLPASIVLVPLDTGVAATQAFCRGEADALFLNQYTLHRMMLVRPPECRDGSYQLFGVPEAPLEISIGVGGEKRAVAQRLRQRIDEMALDQTLAEIAQRYPPVTASANEQLARLAKARHQRDLLFYGLAAALVVLGVGGYLLVRLRREMKAHQATEERLREAQRLEAIGRLAGGVAHDFNNLLTVINGFSALSLSRLPAGDPVRGNLEQVLQAGERAADLTRQLLAFGRRQVLQPRLVNLNELLRESEKLLRRLIGEDIALHCALDDSIAPVKADPGQIHQVIMNLAVNGRDAMPEGGKLLISTAMETLGVDGARRHPEAPPGSYVRLSVSDTGHGLDAATRARIFDPFFTTKELGRGSGLGLSTVHGIVSQSGGFIDVESEPGQGATFRVFLPAVAGRAGD